MATNHFSCGRRRLLLAAGAGALLVPLAACGGSRSVPVDIVGTAATAVPPLPRRWRPQPSPPRRPPPPLADRYDWSH